MKNDKYYGSLRSRDNRWGVDLSLSRKQVIITTYIHLLESVSQRCIIESRPDRHSGIGFRPDGSLLSL